jgi:hypothetical protein
MKKNSMNKNIKVITISPPSNSPKKRTSNQKEDIPLQSENSSLFSNNNFINKNDNEKEEYGYVLDQSHELTLNANEKLNGEDKEFINSKNNNNSNKKKSV